MTANELAAFNAGVMAVLDLAERTADAMDEITILKPTRFPFAAEALRALAEEGRELLKGSRDRDATAIPIDAPRDPLRGGHAVCMPMRERSGR